MRKDLNNFYNNLSEWYDLMYLAQGVKPEAYNPHVVKAYDWLIRKKKAMSVLDCACGTGDPLLGLFKCPERPYHLYGSDGSVGMLAQCKQNAKREGIKIIDILGRDPKALPLMRCSWNNLRKKFGSNKFDFTMCRGHSFYHLTTRDALLEGLESFASVTRIGGWILVDTLAWEYDSSGLACGEQGREAAKWRGVLDFTLNPELKRHLPSSVNEDEINRVYFMDTTDYSFDTSSVGNIVQTKILVAFAEKVNAKVEQVGFCKASGAAFSPEEGKKLLRDAGLKDVRQIKTSQFNELCRHVILMGRKG